MFQKVISKNSEDSKQVPASKPAVVPRPIAPSRPPGNPGGQASPVAQQAQEKAKPAPIAPTQPRSVAPPQQASAVRPSVPTGSHRNILSNDVNIKGMVKFVDELAVDGKIDGEIYSDGALTVKENAQIKAKVKTQNVVVYGKVHGNITATNSVILKATAEVVGDIKASRLTMEAGSVFIGKSEVGSQAAAGSSPSPSRTGSMPAPPQHAKPQAQKNAPQQKPPSPSVPPKAPTPPSKD